MQRCDTHILLYIINITFSLPESNIIPRKFAFLLRREFYIAKIM